MIKAKVVLTAWDRTLETRDFSHLSFYFYQPDKEPDKRE